MAERPDQQPGIASSPPRIRRFVIPDLDGEITTVSEPIEDLLRWLGSWADDDPTIELPPMLSWPAAEAVGEVLSAIDNAAYRTLYAPDGRYQHLPLAVVAVPEPTVARFVAVLDELIEIVAHDRSDSVAAIVDDVSHGSDHVLDAARRLRDLCNHCWGDDEALIAVRLSAVPETGAVLTVAEEAAYRRIRDRLVATWHHHSGIDRWLY